MNTVKSSELASFRMVAGNEKKYDKVIHRHRVKQWVGIGWVDEGPATDEAIEKHESDKHEGDDEGFKQKLRDAMDNMTINVRSVDID